MSPGIEVIKCIASPKCIENSSSYSYQKSSNFQKIKQLNNNPHPIRKRGKNTHGKAWGCGGSRPWLKGTRRAAMDAPTEEIGGWWRRSAKQRGARL